VVTTRVGANSGISRGRLGRDPAITKGIVMNPIHHLRRIATAVAGLAGALLAFAAAAPTVLASGPGSLPPATPQPIRWFPPGWTSTRHCRPSPHRLPVGHVHRR
jgi:hypothetical protein